jgi:outer membrane protein assembly factor BamE
MVLCGLAVVALAMAACNSFDRASRMVPDVVTPYSMDVVQGNVVTSEQLAALKEGMLRSQVQMILGTPLLVSAFHTQRWDYTFTLKRQGVAPQERHVTVFFKDDRVERIEADPLPSEADFVGSLRKPKDLAAPKPLSASPEALAKYPAPVAQSARPAPPFPGPMSYPPLEPAVK